MKKGCVKPMLFDYIIISDFPFSLLHAEIGVVNKVVYSFLDLIDRYIEQISYKEIVMHN